MLTVKEAKCNLNLEVHDLSMITGCSKETFPDYLSDYFFIVYVANGVGAFKYFDQQVHLYPGSVYFFSPGQINFLRHLISEGTALAFSSTFLSSQDLALTALMTRGLFSTSYINLVKIPEQKHQEVERLLMLMHAEYSGISSLKQEVLHALLRIFLADLLKKIPLVNADMSVTATDADLAARFLEMVHANFLTMKKVSEYADRLCITPNYLSAKIRIVTGYSARYHIQQRIVQEAKHHVGNGSRTLKEVAYMLGFDDLSHFSKFFKNITGMNFTHFKKSSMSLLN
ncbi:helix-turn-helix domain-containing protein [Foetidibacter luteolus]|uniref:helix-turn-helix domain-containing protein n=1 Tax=Foetidibacter luteolus TaxID=2608880 RepID=UPI00129B8204|nr:helix-turn-helix transcriptional regulator [Foetidibacter luteolus]